MGTLEAVPFVPVPLVYIDVVLPALTDTELRVLLVIIRQTLGWSDATQPERRKERDWITQSQFQRKTGKSRDAISRAVKGLVEKKLIQVENRAGEPLETPQKRQRARDRLFYRLAPIPGQEGQSIAPLR
jgi:phage replication O-like protein O